MTNVPMVDIAGEGDYHPFQNPCKKRHRLARKKEGELLPLRKHTSFLRKEEGEKACQPSRGLTPEKDAEESRRKASRSPTDQVFVHPARKERTSSTSKKETFAGRYLGREGRPVSRGEGAPAPLHKTSPL